MKQKTKYLFFVGIIFIRPVIFFSYSEVFRFAGTDTAAHLTFAFTSIVQFVTGSRIHIGAFRIAKMVSANMDTLAVDIRKRVCKACIMNADGSIAEDSEYDIKLTEAEIFHCCSCM